MSWVIQTSVIVNSNSHSHFTKTESSKMFSAAAIGVVVGRTVGFSVWFVVGVVDLEILQFLNV